MRKPEVLQLSRQALSALVSIVITLILTVFTQCTTAPSAPSPPSSNPTVLALITAHDPIGSFSGLESTLTRNLSALPQPSQLTSRRVGNINNFRSIIDATTAVHGRIDTLILACHGTPGSLRLGKRENINQRNLHTALDQVETHLADDARVILYACLTGEGEDNFAIDLAHALKRPVIAPRFFWLMQRAVPLEARALELAFDRTGHLTVNGPAFALYYKARLDSGRDRYLIAPKTMEAQCRADGYQPRVSRFRSLFEQFP